MVAILAVLGLAAPWLFPTRVTAPIAARLIERVLPWPAGEISLTRVELHGLHGLTALGVRIRLRPGDDVLEADTLVARFSLRELFAATRRIQDIRVAGLRIDAVRSGTGWSWLEPFADTAATAAPESAPLLAIDRLEVSAARLLAVDDTGNLILGIDGFAARGGRRVIGRDASLELDDATLRLDGPGRTPGPLGIDARVSLAQGIWQVDSVLVTDTAGGRPRLQAEPVHCRPRRGRRLCASILEGTPYDQLVRHQGRRWQFHIGIGRRLEPR